MLVRLSTSRGSLSFLLLIFFRTRCVLSHTWMLLEVAAEGMEMLRATLRSVMGGPFEARSWRFPADFSTPMSHQWNITAGRELHNNVTATVGYVANVSRNLLQTIPFDYGVFKNLPDGTPPSASAATSTRGSRSRTMDRRRCESRPPASSTITRFKPPPTYGRATSMAASHTSMRTTSVTAAGRARLFRMKTPTASRRRPTIQPIP